MSINKKDLNWLAGMIDGDGCISFSGPTKFYCPYIHVVSQDYSALERIKSITNCGYMTHPTSRLDRWNVESQSAINILQHIEPYLITKKRQAQIVIEAYANRYRNFRKTTEVELQKRKTYVDLLHTERLYPVYFDYKKDTEDFWKWYGGFFDSDGCVTLSLKNTRLSGKFYYNYQTVINVSNTHKPTIDFIAKQCPYSNIQHRVYTKDKNQKDLWTIRIQNDTIALYVAKNLYKVTFIKKEEIGLLIQYLKLNPSERRLQKHTIYNDMVKLKNRVGKLKDRKDDSGKVA